MGLFIFVEYVNPDFVGCVTLLLVYPLFCQTSHFDTCNKLGILDEVRSPVTVISTKYLTIYRCTVKGFKVETHFISTKGFVWIEKLIVKHPRFFKMTHSDLYFLYFLSS